MQEHANLSTGDVNINKNLQNNHYETVIHMPLKCGDHIEVKLEKEDSFIGLASAQCTSVERLENMRESKMNTDRCKGCFRNQSTVSSARPHRYNLRSSNFEKQKKLTTHDVTMNGLLDSSHFEEDETSNSLFKSIKTPRTSCLNRRPHSDVGMHLSECAKIRIRRIQENSVEQLSKSSASPAILKPGNGMETAKKNGQLCRSRRNINHLEGGNSTNYLLSCCHNMEKNTEFGSTRDIQCISSVCVCYKEDVQNKDLRGNSHCSYSQKEEAVYQNNPCIRPCYVKLEDITQQRKISPCKSNSRLRSHKAPAVRVRGSESHKAPAVRVRGSQSRKAPAVHSHGSESNLLNRLSCKSHENNILFTNVTSEKFPCEAVHDSIAGFVEHEETDVCRVSLHVPTKAEKKNQLDKIAVRSRCITEKKTRTETHTKVTKTSVQESGFGKNVVEVRSKMLHIEKQCAINSVQIEQGKQFRRETVKGKEHKSKKSVNNLHTDKFNVLSKMKPFSICLERLDQSVLEKYSVMLSSKTTQQKNTGIVQQEMIPSDNKAETSSDVRKKTLRSGKLKCFHRQDKIACLDGVFESSSSDDSSESSSVKHSEPSGKTPVTKNARTQETITQKVENKLADLQDKNADYSNSCIIVGTSLRKPGFETPAENLRWKNRTSSSEICSPVSSPRKSLYPPLAIKIQKSPNKRIVDTEITVQVGSDISEPEDISRPRNANSNRGRSGKRSGEETKIRRERVAVEQKFTNVQVQEQPKDTCNIFKNRKRKFSSISVRSSQIFPKSHPMATQVAVPASSICHSVRATEDHQNISPEKLMYVMSAPLVHFL
jgi:hypothetical protein